VTSAIEAVLFKHVRSACGIVAMNALTCCSILVKTLNEPLEASCNTSPKVVKRLADVVSSQQEQITVGADNDACVQTPVIKAQTLALASETYDLLTGMFSLLTKIDYAI